MLDAMSFFEELPRELQLCVAESCTRPTLPSLSTASKALHQHVTPILYRVADVSSHNGPDIDLGIKPLEAPSDWPVNGNSSIDGIMYDQQRALVGALRSRPSPGKHVRILRWTTVEYSQHVYEAELIPLWDQYNDGENLAEETAHVLGGIHLQRLRLASLGCVCHLQPASRRSTLHSWRPREGKAHPPPPLFFAGSNLYDCPGWPPRP